MESPEQWSAGAEELEQGTQSIESIETENANYRIVLSDHRFPNTLAELGNPDFVVLETGYMQTENPGETIEALKNNEQYEHIIPELALRETPIYFTDVQYKPEAQALIHEEEAEYDEPLKPYKRTDKKVIAGTSALIGAMGALILMQKNESQMTRRQFLKGAVVMGGISAAAFLSSPFSDKLFDAIEEYFDPEKKERREKLDELIEAYGTPRDLAVGLVLAFRNAAIAEKTEKIAEKVNKETGVKPNITLFIGASHIMDDKQLGLDELLRLKNEPSETRKNIIQNFMKHEAFKEHVASPEEVARIGKVQYSNETGTWHSSIEYDTSLAE